nr:hypothetical protein [Nitrosomonas cryotolerans]
MQTSLMPFTRANPASPTIKKFNAALTLRSRISPHAGYLHSRTFNDIFPTRWPQPEQRFSATKQGAMPIRVQPCYSHGYASYFFSSVDRRAVT